LDPIANPPALPENPGPRSVNLSGITAGPFESQTLTVTATSNNPTLVPDPTIDYTSPNATGSLTFTPVDGQTGSATITVTVTDDGPTGGANVNVFTRTFFVSVGLPTNTAPSFAKGADPIDITDESPLQTIVGWATSISAGPPADAGQTLDFTVTPDDPSLFTVPPAINAAGTLTFQPAPNVRGTAALTVVLKDNGGTENGGSDTSPPQFFQIPIAKPFLWFNTKNPLDVNNSGGDPVGLDVLLIFNLLNSREQPITVPANAAIGVPFFYDVSHDNNVTAIDALRIINFLNRAPTGGPEGEGAVDGGSLENGAAHSEFANLIALLAADASEQAMRRRRGI
jgi:hypothetical protein